MLKFSNIFTIFTIFFFFLLFFSFFFLLGKFQENSDIKFNRATELKKRYSGQMIDANHASTIFTKDVLTSLMATELTPSELGSFKENLKIEQIEVSNNGSNSSYDIKMDNNSGSDYSTIEGHSSPPLGIFILRENSEKNFRKFLLDYLFFLFIFYLFFCFFRICRGNF